MVYKKTQTPVAPHVMRYTVLLVVLALSFAPTECDKSGFISRIANIFSKKVLKHVPKEEDVVKHESPTLLNSNLEEVTVEDTKKIEGALKQQYIQVVKEKIQALTGLTQVDDAIVHELQLCILDEHAKMQLELSKKIQEFQNDCWVLLDNNDATADAEMLSTVTMLLQGLSYVRSSASLALADPKMQKNVEETKDLCLKLFMHLVQHARSSAINAGLQMALQMSPQLDNLFRQPLSVTTDSAWKIVYDVTTQYAADVQAESTKTVQDKAPVIVKTILRAVASYYAPWITLLV